MAPRTGGPRCTAWVMVAALLISACTPTPDAATQEAEPVRAVRTVLAELRTPQLVRTFPSVLEPRELTTLAFEVGGRLGDVDLQIGQTVERGEVLLEIESRDFELRLAQAQAALAEAESGLANARDEAERQRKLFERGVVSTATRDQAVTALEQAGARVEQSLRNVDLVAESRDDTRLRAPFDGVINAIEVNDFANVKAGDPVLSLYRAGGFQTRMLVSYDVVSQLSLGEAVSVRPSDRQGDVFEARITEIAGRAPAVSAFPVVATLDDPADYLRSGMAVEVAVALPEVDARAGVPLPVSALATHAFHDLDAPEGAPVPAKVFVVDPSTSTVRERAVMLGGVEDASVLVVSGLEEGERVVSAGVPFLHEGQEVILWREDHEPNVGVADDA